MTQFISMADLADSVIAEAILYYEQAPAVFAKVDPRVPTKAFDLSCGNIHRLTVEHDGAVIVWNHIVW